MVVVLILGIFMVFSLESVRANFEKWRQDKKNRKERIPESLLKEASLCAKKYGFSRTCLNLRLSGESLRKAIKENFVAVPPKKITESKIKSSPSSLKRTEEQSVDFFEIKLKPKEDFGEERRSFDKTEVLYEFENRSGVKLKVFRNAVDWNGDLLNKFFGMR